MADSSIRAQRAAALEEKRRRLDEIKQRRTRRDEDTAKIKASATANLDEYIDGLLSQPAIGGAAAAPQVGSETEKNSANAGQSSFPVASPSQGAKVDAAGDALVNNVVAEPAPAPLIKNVETFTVSTQTEDDDFVHDVVQDQHEEIDDQTARELLGASQNKAGSTSDIPSKEKDPRVLSTEEIEKEVATAPFASFINTASKKVERMLGAEVLNDLLVDYFGEIDNTRKAEVKDDVSSKFIFSRQIYECTKWTAGRDITDMDWSPLHRELILSTYHMPSSAASASQPVSKGSTAISAVAPSGTMSSSLTPRSGELQSDGLVLVWSLSMPNRPEHIFTCGSPVTTGRFHPSESTLIIGGCESGQLVVWDFRAGRLPVQKSALTSVAGSSGKGHTHPVSSADIIEGGSGLVTTSADGKVNFWSMGNLREPTESMQVGESLSCFGVAPESGSILLGDENGMLYAVTSSQSSGQRTSRRQLRKLETVDGEGESLGHFGMVTALSTKTIKKGSQSDVGLSKGFLRGCDGLVLSAGVDWTVKMWAPAYSDVPLVSFVSHSYDYMSDVKWSPSHPSLFATASSNGTVGLWDLAVSFEEPLTGQEGIVVEPDAMSSGRGVNKLKWSLDGRRLVVASSDKLHMLTLAEDVVRCKGDEGMKLMNQLMSRGLISRQ